MKIGVWIDTNVFNENVRFYSQMMRLGIDFLVTDFPLAAMGYRNA